MSSKSGVDKKADGINWITAVWMLVFHLGAAAALFTFSWTALVVAVALWWVAGSPGVGMGFHRLLTHRGYKTPKWVEYLLTVCGTLAFEGGPVNWVVTHRLHHAHTDAPGDPHTPRDGGWWAHVGWILAGTAQRHEPSVLWRYAPDMMRDPFHRLVNRFYYVPVVICGLLLLAVGGWSVFVWGIFFRIVFNLHATWLVNSVTHMWGRRRFATDDDSTNSWWVALLTFGEGWHNNHHAHPVSAKHGLAWYEVDFNWWGIRTLEFFGLARAIKRIPLNADSAER
jgi:stearoyl-CoA desaturase (delta-9 desaturase)